MSHGQQGLYLMQGVLSTAQHGHIPAAVEKGIAGGAVAHAVALQPGKARNARRCPGSPGGQNDSIGGEIPGQRLHGQLVGVGQAHGLGGDELHPHGFGTLDAPVFQLGTGDGLGKAVVVLDELGPVQCAGALGQNGGLHPGAHGIQCRRDTCGAGTDDHNVWHGSFSLW